MKRTEGKERPRFRRKKRPPSGSFPRVLEGRRGKAPGGIKGRAERQSRKSPWRSRSCAEVWSLEPAVGGESRHRGGDASWERGQACCAARSCAVVCGTWREPERLRSQGTRPVGPCLTVGRWRGDVEGHTISHHEGEGSLHGLVGLFRSTKLHVIKAYGSSLPLAFDGVFSLLFFV